MVVNRWGAMFNRSCLHLRVEIDRLICPCGFRHVYCIECETKIDTDPCPWIKADAEFVPWMRGIWGGGTPATEPLD